MSIWSLHVHFRPDRHLWEGGREEGGRKRYISSFCLIAIREGGGEGSEGGREGVP